MIVVKLVLRWNTSQVLLKLSYKNPIILQA